MHQEDGRQGYAPGIPQNSSRTELTSLGWIKVKMGFCTAFMLAGLWHGYSVMFAEPLDLSVDALATEALVSASGTGRTLTAVDGKRTRTVAAIYASGDKVSITPCAPAVTKSSKGGKKYMVNCHPEFWKLFVRPELWHIYGGLIEDYGWEEITPDEASLLKDPPHSLMVCENNVRFNVDKYNSYESFIKMNVEKLRREGTKILLYNDDTHVFSQYSTKQMKYLLEQTDAIISTYAYLLDFFFAKVKPRCHPTHIWLPHSASPSYTELPFNHDPEHKIFLSGSVLPGYYPLRHYLHMKYIIPKHPGFANKKHPGFGKHSLNQTTSYAKMIHENVCGVSTTMIVRRLVAKSFEVPATGALLLINLDLEPMLSALGFQNKRHYVGMENDDPDPMVAWVLDPENRHEIDDIRQRGRDLILRRHTIRHRAAQLDAYVTEGKEPFPFDASELRPDPCPMKAKAVRNFTEERCRDKFGKMHMTHFMPNGIDHSPIFEVDSNVTESIQRRKKNRGVIIKGDSKVTELMIKGDSKPKKESIQRPKKKRGALIKGATIRGLVH